MALLQKITLLFLSIFCSFAASAAEVPEVESLPTQKCAFDITMERGHITGILITRCSGDTIVGTMINEFGVSALSFIYDTKRNKIKLQDVMAMLNKWYIKRVLKKDLSYAIHIIYDIEYKPDKNYIVTHTPHETSITNKKRKITYTFRSINTENQI